MALRNSADQWGSLAKALHWLVAIGIFVLIWLGWSQSEMPSGDERTRIRLIHGSIALVMFVLMTVRIIWRWMNETPAHPDGLPAWQRLSATLQVEHELAIVEHDVGTCRAARRATRRRRPAPA